MPIVVPIPDERPMSEEVSALLAKLELREERLQDAIKANTEELAKVKTSIAALHGLRSSDGKITGNTTRAVIRRYLETIGPDEPFTADDLLTYAETEGQWISGAVNRRGAFAVSLTRMHEIGQVIRSETAGIYLKPHKKAEGDASE